MILLEGCVQPAMAPNINTSTARVLDALGIEVLRPATAGCCGAIRYHLNDQDGGLDDARRNIDAWWPLIEAGAEAIVMNASSGCGQQVKEYDHMLARDPAYAAKAKRVSELTKDVTEILPPLGDDLKRKLGSQVAGKVVFHSPCTLQHGLKVKGAVEALLTSLGATVAPVGESHFCCGSARNLLGAPAGAFDSAARSSPRSPAGAAAGRDPIRQHRLHHSPAERHRDARDALDEWLDKRLTSH